MALISGELDGAAILLRFQHMLQGRLNADCRCCLLDLAEGLSELADAEPADCTVLLYQGVAILRDRSDWDPELLGDVGAAQRSHESANMVVLPTAERHSVLDGVGPFSSHCGSIVNPYLPAEGTCPLLVQDGDASRPVAWARECCGRRQFYTSLGCADDFRQPSFCRMLTNAVAWVARSAV